VLARRGAEPAAVTVDLRPPPVGSPPEEWRAGSPEPAGGKVSRAVTRGVERWRESQGPSGAARGKAAAGKGHAPPTSRPERASPLLPDGSLPRPERLRVHWATYSNPPRRDLETFRASSLAVAARLVVWVLTALRFFGGVLWDAVRQRNTQQHRARRLRETLESAGATFIKIGQQLSMRIDLIPYAYAQELEKMLDAVPSFPTAQAVRSIEAAAGKPLHEAYAVFDPEPIASASIACVYQALLPTGERVAIKVRRPGIGEMFAADMGGLSWILRVLELFFLPPRFSRNLIHELSSMLMEELDFVREARYTELFRRRAKKAKLALAPRVHFALSSRQVLVTQFVTGIFLTEVLAAVESKDPAALAQLAEHRIDPAVVARKLIRINRFGGFEEILFHADLHPGNVLVQPGNRIVLIDFGSCGAFTERERVVWRRVMYAQSVGDVGAMVQAGLALLEPLPPIDIDEFHKRAEAVFWQDMYAIKSKHSEWWERTTANYWISFLRLAREFNIPMNLNTLRMIRVALLADTIALRLDDSIDHYDQYRKYLRGAGRRARTRLRKQVQGLADDAQFIQWEQVYHGFGTAVYRLQRLVDQTSLQFSRLQSKAAFGITVAFRTGFAIFLATAAAMGGLALYSNVLLGEPLEPTEMLRQVTTSPWWQLFVGLALFVAARRLLYRLKERQAA
jgi:ubiquinone biosynthesis protein